MSDYAAPKTYWDPYSRTNKPVLTEDEVQGMWPYSRKERKDALKQDPMDDAMPSLPPVDRSGPMPAMVDMEMFPVPGVGRSGAPQVSIKSQITDEALYVTSGARREAYGLPENNFHRIALFWQAYFQATGRDIEVSTRDVPALMRLMKEARLCETPDHWDSYVDIVGYALNGAEINGVEKPDGTAKA